ncbi:hypothetical protein ACVIIV_004613 [Bradyrhizobium sp. USDA 4354]
MIFVQVNAGSEPIAGALQSCASDTGELILVHTFRKIDRKLSVVPGTNPSRQMKSPAVQPGFCFLDIREKLSWRPG